MLLGKNREIAPERGKRLGQSGNNAQLWMCRVVKLKVQCCKEIYSIGTWNIKSKNQGKLDVVKQEMARVNILELECKSQEISGITGKSGLEHKLKQGKD